MIDSPSPSSSSSNQQQAEVLPRRPSSNSDQPPLTMAEEPSIGNSFFSSSDQSNSCH